MSDFKGRHFRGEIVLWAVRWYCQYPISYRDLEAMMTERGVAVADRIPAVPAYGPEHDLPPEVTSLEVAHVSTPLGRSRRHVTK